MLISDVYWGETTVVININDRWKLVPSYLAEYQFIDVSGVESPIPDSSIVDVMFLY